jgi:hypothetical protein
MIHRIFSITALILLLHTSNSYRAIPSQKNSGKAYTSQTINKFSYNAVEHNRYKSILIEKGRSFELYTSWFDDDLPNILGINPFEAAILFGALYKFYGSAVLYDFAREAGKLFNTYAPIVRDLSLDIFNEGKDYLEEDRDRELLKKGGVDVENMPRKTTNIIERFQEGMKAQEEAGQGGIHMYVYMSSVKSYCQMPLVQLLIFMCIYMYVYIFVYMYIYICINK